MATLSELETEYQTLAQRLKLDQKEKELYGLTKDSEKADFWLDNLHASQTMKQIAKLKSRLEPWLSIRDSMNELNELSSLKDQSLETEIKQQTADLKAQLNKLKGEMKLSGPYDDYDAILNIYAGAGGTDAQDWAEMLFRMYSRWAEKNDMETSLLDQTAGEEAGLKSLSLDVSGAFAYGKLQGESGVHRLVRLSPFNADHLRQTSFARVEVYPKIDRPEEADISEKDLKVDVFRSGGRGGQSVNTTDSAVRITHLPTNISVSMQNERSQLQNKELAMTILRSRLISLKLEQHAKEIATLKGPNISAEWGNQIRSYVLHPYKMVKDLRTGFESNNPEKVLDGELNPLIEAYLDYRALSEAK